MWGIIAPEYKERFEAALETTIAAHSKLQVEYRVITPAGERRRIEIRGYVITDAEDAVTIFAGASQNITARKDSEQHRKVLARELGIAA